MKLRNFVLRTLLGVSIAFTAITSPAHAEKIRDLADVSGARDNQLLGYGIVTGLSGTGDDVSAPFAMQSMQALLRRLGVQVDSKQLRLRNVAAVLVTGTLPPFAKSGSKLDVTVASIGNAKALSGGLLVQTLLKGPDQKIYAVAQGNVLTGGFSASGSSGSSVKSGTQTAGRVPEGAIVEREVASSIVSDNSMKLMLRNPSFSLAAHMAEAIDKQLGQGTATAPDSGSVIVNVPTQYRQKPVELVAALEDIEVNLVRKARVVVSERTQTIVAGGDVRLSPVVVVHGSLTIVVKETPKASQPNAPILTGILPTAAPVVPPRATKGGKRGAVGPIPGGNTVVVPESDIQTSEGDKQVHYMKAAATLADVASALGSLGLPPRELASVLQALRTAGALEAEVIVQ